MAKPGRNEPCPCGSGKKYKKCCLHKEVRPAVDMVWQLMRKTEGELVATLLKHANKCYSPEAIVEAWNEFSLWRDLPMEPESQPEVDTAFLPWFLFNWIPDNTDVDKAGHYPEMQVALHYLHEKGPRIDPFQRRFIEEICSQPYSFFMVTQVEPGRRLSLRDLLLRRETSVHERSASTTLSKGSILYTRIVTLDDSSIMVGCAPTAIPPAYLNNLIDFREKMVSQFPGYGRALLLAHDSDLRTLYYQIRHELYNPPAPQLQNTDGDALQLTELFYKLQCTPQEALSDLATLSMAENARELLREGKFDSKGELLSIEIPWLKKGNRKIPEWDNTIMGKIRIEGDQLIIEVNSQERSEAIQRKIARRLGKRAVFRNAVIRSTEKMLEELANRPPGVGQGLRNQQLEDLQALPEIQQRLKEMGDKHWKAWLDTPLPALRKQTPREAAKTALGRELLEALFWEFEKRGESAQPFSPDIEALKKSLGMD